MARRPLYPLYDRILDGKLSGLLTQWRADGASHEEIAGRLRSEHEIVVTSETVRRWCRDLGVPGPEAVAS